MSQADDKSELTPSRPRRKRTSLNKIQAQSQLDFDVEFFGRILERNADYVDVLRCQGELLTLRGDHARALSIDERLVQLRPGDVIIRYNLACSLALGNRPEEAVAALRAAIEQGYDDFPFLECDRDLDSLRSHPGFQALMKQYGIGD